MNFSPLSSPCLTQVSPTNFSQHWPPPIWLAPRPAHCVQVPESPATSSHLSRGGTEPRAFPGPWWGNRAAGQTGYAQRRRPGSSQCTALRLWQECHSPPGCGGPLQRAGAAGRRQASGPAGTWRGCDKRCLREGAAETGREARAGIAGRKKGRERRGQRARP